MEVSVHTKPVSHPVDLYNYILNFIHSEIASTALPTPTISSSNLGLYIGITAVLSIILTAIVAGIILACVIYRLRKKKNNPTVATLSSSSYVVKQELESNFGVKNEMTENNNHA